MCEDGWDRHRGSSRAGSIIELVVWIGNWNTIRIGGQGWRFASAGRQEKLGLGCWEDFGISAGRGTVGGDFHLARINAE